jgi:hypothetical protein
MMIQKWKTVPVIAILATLGLGGAAWANHAGPFDFDTPAEYDNNFEDIRRGLEINQGLDLGGTGHTAVNFTGTTGSAGDTWLTAYYPEDANVTTENQIFSAVGGLCMRADVQIHRFNNAKGAGLVALLNDSDNDEVFGLVQNGKGLALLLIDNGNTDRLTLNTLDANTGKLVQLATVPLGSGIAENAWYRMHLRMSTGSGGTEVYVEGQIRKHDDPTNPNSPTTTVVGSTLQFDGALLDMGLASSGEIGIFAWAKSAVVDSSVTNFEAADGCGGI